MKTVDVEDVITRLHLDKRIVASHIFDGAKYPVQALDRVMYGGAELNAPQLVKLAEIARIPVADLFQPEWSMRSKGCALALRYGGVLAVLDPKTLTTTVHIAGAQVYSGQIGPANTAISEYIELLNAKIKEYED